MTRSPRSSLFLLALAAASVAAALARLQQAAAPTAPPPAQAAAAPAAEASAAVAPATESGGVFYGGAIVDACIQLTNSAGQACTVESDTLSLVYSRGSEKLPTPEEVSTAINNMKAAAQPSDNCCQEMKPYVDARCPCDPDYQQLLPIGGFDPAYFIGATSILAQACGFDFPPCVPGEHAKPPASLVKTGGR